MGQSVSPLLIIADLPSDFSLANLPLSEHARQSIKINTAKYQGLDMLEVLLDGMTFTLKYHNAVETHENLRIGSLKQIFCNAPAGSSASIGTALGENMADGKHIPTVNRTFLRLAQLIGESMKATHAAWLPADQIAGFDYFAESVTDYVDGGPIPALLQIAIAETDAGQFETTGLDYFAEQEVRLAAPTDFPAHETIKRLVRIARDIATNGKIDNETEMAGLAEGEKLLFRPSKDSRYLNVSIRVANTDRRR